MKKFVSFIFVLAITCTIFAQSTNETNAEASNEKTLLAERKFQIIVENEKNVDTIINTNARLLALQEASSRTSTDRFLLAELLWAGYTSAFTQKTINATSNLISLGLNYAIEALKSDREKWYRRAQEQCYYHKTLSTETQVHDFYATPSTNGALDPENLKFEGFGCKNYIEVMDGSKEGVGIFYIFCKMRRDEVGLNHIVNHSKFLVELDSLIINPKFCNLPNDSTGSAKSRFDFSKRDNLCLEFKVRLYSSWMNQAIMITNDQLLGEFTVCVNVDKKKLNKDGYFIYDKNDPDFDDLISIYGNSYLVPRSYTGTNDGETYKPTWGTGQYRIEMEVSESCSIVDSYYQIRESGHGEAVAYADATPGKKKWDKAKWKVEWKAMNSRPRKGSFIKDAWKCIVSAYKGNGWVATLTDPMTTAIYSWETQKLGEWIDDMHDKVFRDEETNAIPLSMPIGK